MATTVLLSHSDRPPLARCVPVGPRSLAAAPPALPCAPQAQATPGIMVCRIDAPIYFANIQFVRDRLRKYAARFREWSKQKGAQASQRARTPLHPLSCSLCDARRSRPRACRPAEPRLLPPPPVRGLP